MLTLWVTLLSSAAYAQTWNGPRAYNFFGTTCTTTEAWCLGTVSVVQQLRPNDRGGPQALEGYTRVAHKTGTVRLVLGTIGNLELGGASGTVVEEARALQGGIVVTGAGVVNRPVSLFLGQPQRHSEYDGPMNVKDPVYIQFDNGWTIRPSGADLLICNPRGECRAF